MCACLRRNNDLLRQRHQEGIKVWSIARIGRKPRLFHHYISWTNNGVETCFIHDELLQRLNFIQYKEQEILFSSTPSFDDDWARENLSDCIDVVSLSIMNDKSIPPSHDVQAFDSLLKLHEFCTDVISIFCCLVT